MNMVMKCHKIVFFFNQVEPFMSLKGLSQSLNINGYGLATDGCTGEWIVYGMLCQQFQCLVQTKFNFDLPLSDSYQPFISVFALFFHILSGHYYMIRHDLQQCFYHLSFTTYLLHTFFKLKYDKLLNLKSPQTRILLTEGCYNMLINNKNRTWRPNSCKLTLCFITLTFHFLR